MGVIDDRSEHFAVPVEPVAYAVGYKINYFCTCDDRFLKKTTEIETGLTKVFNVVDLIQKIEL